MLEKLASYITNKIQVVENGCWLWTASKSSAGYGQIRIDYKLLTAHKTIWEFFNGEVPQGLELDHLCRNRGCVNPQHLEPVTHQENSLRGLRNQNYNKTHCKHGHELTADNVYLQKRGERVCKKCLKFRTAKWKENRALTL